MVFNLIYRVFLTLDAVGLVGIIFLAKEGPNAMLCKIFGYSLPDIVWDFVLLVVYIVVTYGLLWISQYLGTDTIEGGITAIEPANNAFLPSYLGYFFVGLSIPNCDVFVFVFGILSLFTFVSQTLYFNPLFLLFGYQFYYLSTKEATRIFIISKRNVKNIEGLSFLDLRRITDFTFIEVDEHT